ncbi:hypothetical protein P170DRAFT_322481, partial [Aspergillus steynii IBT 23096]
DIWKMTETNQMCIDEAEQSVYNAQSLLCSALAQEYLFMIQQGVEYSYLTTGTALILLRVPDNDPRTLY